MQIAEEVVKSGKTGGELFLKKLTSFVSEMKFKKLIETGTFHGTGTTRAIVDGLKGDYTFFTIEVDPENYKIAQNNLKRFKGVHVINGLSIEKSKLPISISNDLPDFVVVDHKPINRIQLYLKEVSHDVPDHALNDALVYFNYKPEFVLLDSAGYMGYHEFLYLMKRVQSEFYLALDDTDHYKHYTTMLKIKEDPRFEIIWSVRGVTYVDELGEKDKFGSAIIKFTP